MRAKKREKNAPKELKKLKGILGLDKGGELDVEMKELVTGMLSIHSAY